jgi:DNA processing protein
MEKAARENIRVLTPWSALFPAALKAIPASPLILYAKGNAALLGADGGGSRAAAVIGTTTPSPAGTAAARRITRALCGSLFIVVSGLAAGCDTAAHDECLRRGGRTIAVLAHGVDYCYPRQNKPLADAIVASGGLLLAEYAPGETPRRHYFDARDRLPSGLSRGVCVAEAEVSGGTMHTVAFAQKQGRLVGSAPLPAGGNRLLLERQGAHPLGTDEQVAAFIACMTE